MINKNRLFQYGLLIGMIVLIIQGIIIDKIGIPLLILVNVFLAIILVLSGKLKALIGLIMGYILASIIFVALVYVIYSMLLYFTKP